MLCAMQISLPFRLDFRLPPQPESAETHVVFDLPEDGFRLGAAQRAQRFPLHNPARSGLAPDFNALGALRRERRVDAIRSGGEC